MLVFHILPGNINLGKVKGCQTKHFPLHFTSRTTEGLKLSFTIATSQMI